MAHEFNSEVDKITERELVFDILDRLSFGRNIISEDGDVYIDKETKLSDVLKNIIKINIDNNEYYKYLKVINMKIPAGASSAVVSVSNLKYRKILKAISKQTGMDYKDYLETYSENEIWNITFNSNTSFTHNEEIKLYLI